MKLTIKFMHFKIVNFSFARIHYSYHIYFDEKNY